MINARKKIIIDPKQNYDEYTKRLIAKFFSLNPTKIIWLQGKEYFFENYVIKCKYDVLKRRRKEKKESNTIDEPEFCYEFGKFMTDIRGRSIGAGSFGYVYRLKGNMKLINNLPIFKIYGKEYEGKIKNCRVVKVKKEDITVKESQMELERQYKYGKEALKAKLPIYSQYDTYLIMEEKPGMLVRNIYSIVKYLDIHQLTLIFKSILKSYQAQIHYKNFIHSDIKEDNIIVNNFIDAEQSNAFFIDFGVSTGQDEEFKMLGGTPRYMDSTLQKTFQTQPQIDKSHDIYSLGITLQKILSAWKIEYPEVGKIDLTKLEEIIASMTEDDSNKRVNLANVLENFAELKFNTIEITKEINLLNQLTLCTVLNDKKILQHLLSKNENLIKTVLTEENLNELLKIAIVRKNFSALLCLLKAMKKSSIELNLKNKHYLFTLAARKGYHKNFALLLAYFSEDDVKILMNDSESMESIMIGGNIKSLQVMLKYLDYRLTLEDLKLALSSKNEKILRTLILKNKKYFFRILKKLLAKNHTSKDFLTAIQMDNFNFLIKCLYQFPSDFNDNFFQILLNSKFSSYFINQHIYIPCGFKSIEDKEIMELEDLNEFKNSYLLVNNHTLFYINAKFEKELITNNPNIIKKIEQYSKSIEEDPLFNANIQTFIGKLTSHKSDLSLFFYDLCAFGPAEKLKSILNKQSSPYFNKRLIAGDECKNTAIHWAIRYENDENTALLLKYCFSINPLFEIKNLINSDQESPLAFAHNSKISALLQKYEVVKRNNAIRFTKELVEYFYTKYKRILKKGSLVKISEEMKEKNSPTDLLKLLFDIISDKEFTENEIKLPSILAALPDFASFNANNNTFSKKSVLKIIKFLWIKLDNDPQLLTTMKNSVVTVSNNTNSTFNLKSRSKNNNNLSNHEKSNKK